MELAARIVFSHGNIWHEDPGACVLFCECYSGLWRPLWRGSVPLLSVFRIVISALPLPVSPQSGEHSLIWLSSEFPMYPWQQSRAWFCFSDCRNLDADLFLTRPDFGPNDIDFPPLPDINNTDIRQQIFTHRSLYGRPTHLFEDHPDDLSPDNEK